MWKWFKQWGAAPIFYQRSKPLIVCLSVLYCLTFAYGLIASLWLSPPDYQQGESVRIIYIHVPSAFLSMGLFSFMAICATVFLIWRIKLADILIQVTAPLGASFTFLALITGAIWGKPTWGTWWIWDARLTSELILLFIYFGVIGIRQALPHPDSAALATAIFVLIGFVDIPLIHFSVNWWHTLHQGASLSAFTRPSIDGSMLQPLVVMIVGFGCFAASQILSRASSELRRREAHKQWVQQGDAYGS